MGMCSVVHGVHILCSICHSAFRRLLNRCHSLMSMLNPESLESLDDSVAMSVTTNSLELDSPWLPTLPVLRQGRACA